MTNAYIQIMINSLMCISEMGVRIVAGLSGVIVAVIIIIAAFIKSKKKDRD